ncbi:type I 3-dehydroquinate dehydratase [Methanobacterium ferruginis]|jgi:3-dehydroquinate dehydratase-1|uniref:type I 3-dehydroquinate dehydratase n=1 Tax=Methanobacterium ferruginis TaxID=710191 RepID=UPI00257321E0|nr:type I 3-dehydroquinate dehydratase [Methanobacterium ferruginis]MCC7550500.1 type I 3-dehydroquinate dehydratase [Methanobacterium sp.]BDZ69302.1 3-dehydroquinase [Methanobacterium ferruginis]
MISKPLICVPILQKDRKNVLEVAREAIKLEADLVELRIDALLDPDPQEVIHLMEEINYPLIATNRMREEGGYFRGSEDLRTEILIETADHADYIDIELQTEEKYRSQVVSVAKSTIISYHDFQRTPHLKELMEVVKREKEVGNIAKFAVMPQNMQDTLNVLEVVNQTEDAIGIAMGKLGKYTRVVTPLLGSPITYASLKKGSAPGQMDINDTREIIEKLMVGED